MLSVQGCFYGWQRKSQAVKLIVVPPPALNLDRLSRALDAARDA